MSIVMAAREKWRQEQVHKTTEGSENQKIEDQCNHISQSRVLPVAIAGSCTVISITTAAESIASAMSTVSMSMSTVSMSLTNGENFGM